MKSWIEFWDGDHAIYVSERHKLAHAEAVGRDIVRHIPSPDAVVLDHGCGEANYAAHVAGHCRRLHLCEAAPGLRQTLAERVATIGHISVLDPAGVEALPGASLDLVVVNSVVQYLKREELAEMLRTWRYKLKPSGSLVIADVIPPEVSPLADASALLQFGWKGGFLPAAFAGLVRTALSDYRTVRQKLGLSTYSETDFTNLLAEAGFKAGRVHPNFGHNQARMTFRAVAA